MRKTLYAWIKAKRVHDEGCCRGGMESKHSTKWCNQTLIFSTDFLKILVSNFMKNPSSWSQVVIHRCTDMTKLIIAFHNSVNTPKNLRIIQSCYGWHTLLPNADSPLPFMTWYSLPHKAVYWHMNKTDPNFSKNLHPSDLIFLGVNI
jgi:hypothetical protein